MADLALVCHEHKSVAERGQYALYVRGKTRDAILRCEERLLWYGHHRVVIIAQVAEK